MLDRLVADHRPIGTERAFGNVVQRSGLAHFAEDRVPRVLGIDVAAADVPLVRMVQLVLGMFGEMLLECLVGGGLVRTSGRSIAAVAMVLSSQERLWRMFGRSLSIATILP